jgi:hypothetical protein
VYPDARKDIADSFILIIDAATLGPLTVSKLDYLFDLTLASGRRKNYFLYSNDLT